jgi:hypothetical protein
MRCASLASTGLALILTACLAAGCSKLAAGHGGAPRLPTAALDQAIAQGIGDPNTCVLLADPATGKVLYRYGDEFNCLRGLPACDRPGYLTATQALKLGQAPGGRQTSCNSIPDGSRTVGWAEGTTTSAKHPLLYSAVMEGQTALPGREISARLADAFAGLGL